MNRTLQDIKTCTSLNNLKKDRLSAQVATLLILVIAGILIFILAVANIGHISNYATNLSNAADAASLSLASQLGTKSFQFSASLMKSCHKADKCCQKTGLLSVLLAIVIAIIVIIIVIVSWGSAAPLGATFLGAAFTMLQTTAGAAFMTAAAAVGGAVGGAIAGTGALQGAIQGFMIGAALGSIVSLGAGLAGGGAVAGSGGTSVAWDFSIPSIGLELAPISITIPAGAAIPSFVTSGVAAGVATIGASSLAIASVSGAITGAVAGVTLSAASSIYSAYAKDAMQDAAMADAVRKLNGLPEGTRYRESIFLQALSQTVDDPNKAVDTYDSDGDGDTAEEVPYFQIWWDNRIAFLKGEYAVSLEEAKEVVNAFIQLYPSSSAKYSFQGAVRTFETASSTFKAALSRLELESSDGSVVELLRALENAGYDVSFWESGPTYSAYKAWMESTDEDSEAPTGYDELDYVIGELDDFNDEIDTLRSMISSNFDDLIYNWESWLTAFYDPESYNVSCTDGVCSGGDYYTIFQRMINGYSADSPPQVGLNGWVSGIENIRERLPVCTYGTNRYDRDGNFLGCLTYTNSTDCILSDPPCRWHPADPTFGTIDKDFDDEFQAVQDAINNFAAATEAFRQHSVDFYNALVAALDPDMQRLAGYGGSNPITYKWADSRGDHNVAVTLGSFNIPRLIRKKYGNWLKGKKCIILVDHTQNVTVTIKRQDPANKEMGILGSWNPSFNGIIQRKSTAQYRGLAGNNNGYVKLVGK